MGWQFDPAPFDIDIVIESEGHVTDHSDPAHTTNGAVKNL